MGKTSLVIIVIIVSIVVVFVVVADSQWTWLKLGSLPAASLGISNLNTAAVPMIWHKSELLLVLLLLQKRSEHTRHISAFK